MTHTDLPTGALHGPTFVDLIGSALHIFLNAVVAFLAGLLVVLLVAAVKLAPLVAAFTATGALLFRTCPRRRAVTALGLAVGPPLLTYLCLPAPSKAMHPTLGSVLLFLVAAALVIASSSISLRLSLSGSPDPVDPAPVDPDPDDSDNLVGHDQVVATLPPGVAADFYDHVVCCDENRALCGHDVTDDEWGDDEWGPTCPRCLALEEEGCDCPTCDTGATTAGSRSARAWRREDPTGAADSAAAFRATMLARMPPANDPGGRIHQIAAEAIRAAQRNYPANIPADIARDIDRLVLDIDRLVRDTQARQRAMPHTALVLAWRLEELNGTEPCLTPFHRTVLLTRLARTIDPTCPRDPTAALAVLERGR